MRSVIISRSLDVLAGIRLAGIEGVYCKDAEELEKNFTEYKEKAGLGIIVLTESDFSIIKDEVIKVKLSKKLPLVVTIPDEGGLKDKDFILRYIKESIGVKVG